MRSWLLAVILLATRPAGATPPLPPGEVPEDRPIGSHAVGPSLGMAVDGGFDGILAARYRYSRSSTYSLFFRTLQAGVAYAVPDGRISGEIGGSLGLRPIFAVPGLSLSLDAITSYQDGLTAVALAPGLYVTPFFMTSDKWGDLDVKLRGVFHLNDRDRTADRFELVLTLLFNLSRR